jgi:hypothetical protein
MADHTLSTYYVETGMGCNLHEAKSMSQARKEVLAEVGTYNGIQEIRLATKEDIAWVTAMQGRKIQFKTSL